MQDSLKTTISLMACVLLLLSSCKERGCTDPNAANYNADAELDDGSCRYEGLSDDLKMAFRDNYAEIAFAVYDDAYRAALDLQTLVDAFVAIPTLPGLAACKDQWVLAHIPYSQSEIFTGAMGPIDGDSIHYASRINGWEMEPAYLDYLSDSTNAGIVSDTNNHPMIDRAVLRALHQKGDAQRIMLGYHVIEFMLWGEDDRVIIDQQAGDRPVADYSAGDSSAVIPFRRRALLKAATDQLVEDLGVMANQWNSTVANNYRREYISSYSPGKSTRLAMTGVVSFMQFELGRNRILSTLESFDPNREESAFSDNTHRDIYYNALGMRNILRGRYGRIDSTYVEGTSLLEIFEEFDEEEAEQITNLMQEIITLASEIEAPYDYAVSLEQETQEGPISDLQFKLERLGIRITELSAEMGMGIRADLPF
jgi:putative iron-regulated protein